MRVQQHSSTSIKAALLFMYVCCMLLFAPWHGRLGGFGWWALFDVLLWHHRHRRSHHLQQKR